MSRLPDYLKSTQRRITPRSAVGGMTAPFSTRLDFTMEDQQQSLWCWAAVSASISKYYDGASRWTQCRIVSSEMEAACCEDGSTEDCNQVHYLDRALSRTLNLRDYRTRPLDRAEVKSEIGVRAPLGCRVEWDLRSGHFIVIFGIADRNGELWVDVEDPDPNIAESTYPYQEFLNAYRGNGTWTHSYLTGSSRAVGGAPKSRIRKKRRPRSASN